jgi:hypothetical protein
LSKGRGGVKPQIQTVLVFILVVQKVLTKSMLPYPIFWMPCDRVIRIRTESEYNGNRIGKESQRDLKGIRILLAEGNVFLPEDLFDIKKVQFKIKTD